MRPAFEVLRIAAAMCFIGHGAFGFITKAGWVPYFSVVGLHAGWAYEFMPLVGLADIGVGVSVLIWPTRAAFAYMALWGTWTALLRPLAGQGVAEFLERAGNYGVPLALLLLAFGAAPGGRWFAKVKAPQRVDQAGARRVAWVLRATTATLLLGHGLLAAMGKPLLLVHLVGIDVGNGGLSTLGVLQRIGGFEVALALGVLLSPGRSLLLFVCAWKLATEWLYITAGDPVWEFIERGGSYGAPLALALLTRSEVAQTTPLPGPQVTSPASRRESSSPSRATLSRSLSAA
jgi:hypothetical protein